MKLKYLIGNSIDHHLLKQEDGYITLASMQFSSSYKVIAHSDGDVILHAIANCILNALNLDDIGTYFSDTDENNKNMNSLIILEFALKAMKQKGYQINNLSIVLESDKIMLKPIKQLILNKLQEILKINAISIHGTRTEQNLNIISAYATILLIDFGDKFNYEK